MKIFVSYHSTDEASAEQIREGLQREGHDVFVDREMRSSENFADSIRSAIEKCDLFVFLITPSAIQSDNTLAALMVASKHWPDPAGRVLPVMLEPTPFEDLPEYVKAINILSAEEDVVAEIVRAVAEHAVAHQAASGPRIVSVPDIAWIEIPKGEFIYGEGGEQVTRHLDTFWIARYPITNAQFQAFIDDDGYREWRWWWNLEKPEPTMSRRSEGNRPRTDVNWYEAVAFTRWLTARLGLEAEAIRLPTEHEWEKTARGTKGLTYPWGNDYRSGFANIDETIGNAGSWYLEEPTAVGMYPHGRSPFDVEDMAGTVWEWCLNKYGQGEDRTIDISNAPRVLRGGSLALASDLVRATDRYRDPPDSRSDRWGFRVLSSVPIAVS